MLGGDQVEGLHAVHELLASGKRRVRALWVAQDLAGHEPLLGTVLLARRQQVPVQLKSPRRWRPPPVRRASGRGGLGTTGPGLQPG